MLIKGGSQYKWSNAWIQTHEYPNTTLSPKYLHVQVSEAAGSWEGQFDHSFSSDRVAVQVVKQGAVLMVIWH